MSNESYLRRLLDAQDLAEGELDALRGLRDRIETTLRKLPGLDRVYYAGSFGKKTMIREQYDLDIVAYWAQDCDYTLKDIFEAVGDVLRKEWRYPTKKTVAWQINFQGGFHIDVVPGRALDNSFRYANLYRTDTETSLKTSIKIHIDTVRDSGRRDAIRLMKLWRKRRGVPVKKSLALELMTIGGCKGVCTDELEQQLLVTFRHLRDNVVAMRLVDPANSNNVISDEMGPADRVAIRQAAQAALDATYWSEVFRP